jgi:hypothetical protein
VRALVLILLLHTGNASLLAAQSGSNPFLEVTIGANVLLGSSPYGDEYYEEGGMPFLVVAFGNQPAANRPLLGVLHAGILTVAGGDDQCDLTPLGGCYHDFPFGGLIAITVGARPVTPWWDLLELTAGPALLSLIGNSHTFGVLTVGRIGLPPGRYLSPGLAFHGIVAPVRGSLLFTAGVGLSLRTW